jgi:hypothetical protein
MELQSIMNNFVSGKMRLSGKQITTAIDRGGVGCIDVKNFIMSLQCSWVKRAYGNTIDTWRLELNNRTGGNVLLTTPQIFDIDINPILHGISDSFKEFKANYYLRNENFIESYAIGNPVLYGTLRPRTVLHIDFWTRTVPDPAQIRQITGLKIKDFVENGTVNRDNIPIVMMTPIRFQDSEKIKVSIEQSTRFNRRNMLPVPYTDPDLDIFISRFKKGSRPFRKIFDAGRSVGIKVRNET